MNLKKRMRFFGGMFMFLSVALGALASHYLEQWIDEKALSSFQTGVRYLTYHGLGLLALSQFDYKSKEREHRMLFLSMVIGISLFSGSIFILSFKEYIPFPIRWMGPVTPLGGSLLLLAWFLCVRSFRNAS
ncbi:MAG: DUF423 domain-containing protein [Flavobacteriaceae bacterium]